ncbi:MAG: hypothetical protein ABJG68_11560 [Crocinitomicaceae bacterium]
MSNIEGKEILLNMLKAKSGHKQLVFKNTKEWFGIFKKEISDCVDVLKKGINNDKIRLKFIDRGEGEAQLFIGSDVLVFHMHSNVFKLPSTDFATQTSYVMNNPQNAYCGIINVYDFLADSFEYNRHNDAGYMLCRIFINAENHFKVEGKGPMDFIYNNFMNQVISAEIIQEIIIRVAIYALDFDLLTPPYQAVSQVSVAELQTLSSNSKLKTAKRLGFQFSSDHDITA